MTPVNWGHSDEITGRDGLERVGNHIYLYSAIDPASSAVSYTHLTLPTIYSV